MTQIPEIRASFPVVTTSVAASYVAANQFIFEGTDVYGTGLSFCNIIGGVEDATSGDFRLYDVTNALVIAAVLGVTAAHPSIVSLGALANLPATAAIFEIQLKRNTGSGVQSVAVSSMNFG